MASRDGAFGLLIGAAVGTLFLVPAHGLAQWAPFEVDPCSSDVINMSALEGLIRCAESGWAPDQYTLGMMYAQGNGVPEDDAEAVRWYRMAGENCAWLPPRESFGLELIAIGTHSKNHAIHSIDGSASARRVGR